MPSSKKHKKKRQLSRKKIIIISISLALLIALGWFTNIIPFAYMTVRCGRFPVQTTTLGGGSYFLPEDSPYYQIKPLLVEYPYCTAQEAEEAGLHRTPLRAKDTE